MTQSCPRRAMSLARIAAIAAALASAACSKPDAKLSLGFDARGQYAAAARFHAVVTQGMHTRVVRGTSMRVMAQAPGYFVATTEDLRLGPGEPVTVDLHLESAAGNVTERVTWTPQEDWEYGVTAVVDSRRPQGICFGIAHVAPLPPGVANSADTLFVLQSGLPKGAIC